MLKARGMGASFYPWGGRKGRGGWGRGRGGAWAGATTAETAWKEMDGWTGLEGQAPGYPDPLSNWGHHPPSSLSPQTLREFDPKPSFVSRAQQPGLESHLLHLPAL